MMIPFLTKKQKPAIELPLLNSDVELEIAVQRLNQVRHGFERNAKMMQEFITAFKKHSQG